MNSSAPIFLTKPDRPPSLKRYGLTIQREGNTPASTGGDLWLTGILALDPQTLHAETVAPWMRSIFVWATSLGNQRPYGSNLLKDQMLFKSDVTSGRLEGGQPAAIASFRFELLTVLQHPLPPETYLIEVSARQYRSNILIQDVR